MKIFNKLFKFATNPLYRFGVLTHYGLFNYSDKDFLKKKFKLVFGHELNLENPQTYSEKLQWLKLYDRNPLYTIMVDKYKVKDYVANIIGKEHIIPTLGVWNNPEEIDFDKLPTRFVLKCNHNSGLGMCICKDKSQLDSEKVKKELAKGLKQDYYLTNREWPYKNVPRKIFAEQYMENKEIKGLVDYKFFCFNGNPKFLYVSQGLDNHTTARLSFMNMDWSFAPFYRTDYKPFDKLPMKPILFEQMCNIVKILAKNIPFVRVDLYEINNQIYFSEYTFFTGAGFTFFYPNEWNKKIGDWLVLPNKKM